LTKKRSAQFDRLPPEELYHASSLFVGSALFTNRAYIKKLL